MKWNPKTLGGIVTGSKRRDVVHLAAEEEVERGNLKTRKEVFVGHAEQIFRPRHTEPRLFQHFSRQSLLCRLPDVGESSRKVERAKCRFTPASLHEQTSLSIDDDGHVCTAGIQVIYKRASGATPTLLVIVGERLTAAHRAVRELFQGMFHDELCHLTNCQSERGTTAVRRHS